MQKVLVILAGVAVLAAGVLTGQALLASREQTPPTHETKLTLGEPFPSVELAAAGGEYVTTDALVEAGRVVLFMDPVCPGCEDMTARWQDAIDAGRIAADRVMGITLRAAETEAYRAEHGLTFPIFQDRGREFSENWEVRWIPTEVIVGRSRAIRSVRGNEDRLDWNRIRSDLDS